MGMRKGCDDRKLIADGCVHTENAVIDWFLAVQAILRVARGHEDHNL